MPRKIIPWHTIPDSAFHGVTSTALAARLGCTRQNVDKQRQLRGLASLPRGGDRPGPLPEKPAMRLSRAAAAHLRTLARRSGLSPSAYILSLPLPPPDACANP